MKTFNIFSKLIALTIVFGMCLTSCQKDKAPDLSTKKAEIGFNIQLNPDVNGKKTESTEQYYGGDCTYDLTDKAYVEISYNFVGAAEPSEDDLTAKLYLLNNTATTNSDEGFIATQLLQIELDEADSEKSLTITKFVVWDEVTNDGKTELEAIMATPKNGSPYIGYINNKLRTIPIKAFTKVYTEMDVLCFQPDDYLEFGFTWFDFNIVEGEVISVFFNCINADNRERYHEVLPVAIDVYQGVKSEGDIYIEDLKNYSVKPDYSIFEEHFEGTRAINIEVPGKYKSASEEDVVMTVVVKPWGSNEEIDIPLTKKEIDIYAGNTPYDKWKTNGAVKLEYPAFNTDLYVGDFVKGQGEVEEKVMHFQLNECYKPEVAYVDNNGTSVLYAVVPDETNGEAKMTVIDELNIKRVHIAMSPDKRQIYATDKDNSSELYVYDLFDMNMITYKYADGVSPNTFTELVYGVINESGDKKLYASCQTGEVIKEIILEESNKTFTYSPLVYSDNEKIELSGGDLLLDNDGNLFSICNTSEGVIEVKMYKVNLGNSENPFEEFIISVDDIEALKNVTGATILKDGKIITSHANGNFKLWKLDVAGKTLAPDTDVPNLTPEYTLHSGGDMASIFAGLN